MAEELKEELNDLSPETKAQVKQALSGFLDLSYDEQLDVAQASGFYDHSHFSHAFRRLTGVAPAVYREQHR